MRTAESVSVDIFDVPPEIVLNESLKTGLNPGQILEEILEKNSLRNFQ